MITLAKLRRKPRHLRAFTGLTAAEFDCVLEAVTSAYEAAELTKRQRPQRQRPQRQGALTSGRPFRLALPERLLMGLMYVRLYVRQSLLGYLFDLDESNISRELHERLLPILLDVLPTPLRDAPLRALASELPPEKPGRKKKAAPAEAAGTAKPRKRIGTLDELFAAYPEIKEVLLDATEQPVPQPRDKHKRKLAFSGKQQEHTVKTQILATRAQILHVFGGLPGCLSDMLVMRASGVLHCVPKTCKVRLDKGYEGTEAAYPDKAVQAPLKKKRNQSQNVLERAYNYMLSTQRIYVEHHFARLQQWQCLRQEWRGRPGDHEDVFCVVAGLLNFRQSGCLQLTA